MFTKCLPFWKKTKKDLASPNAEHVENTRFFVVAETGLEPATSGL